GRSGAPPRARDLAPARLVPPGGFLPNYHPRVARQPAAHPKGPRLVHLSTIQRAQRAESEAGTVELPPDVRSARTRAREQPWTYSPLYAWRPVNQREPE